MPLPKILFYPSGMVDRIVMRKDSEEEMNLDQFVNLVKSNSQSPKVDFVICKTLGECKKIVEASWNEPTIENVYQSVMKNPYLEMDRKILGYHTTYKNIFNQNDVAHHLLLYRSDAYCEIFFRNK